MRNKTGFPCPVCLENITGWTEEDNSLVSVWAMAFGQGRAIPCGHSVDEMFEEWRRGMKGKVQLWN